MATQADVGSRIDLSVRQVQRLVQKGVLPGPKGSAGYSLDDCTIAYINHLRNKAKAGKAEHDIDPEEDLVDLDYERAMNLRVDTRLKELKEEQIRKETAPVAVIEWTLGKVGSQISAILDAIPLKVKRRIPKLTSSEIDLIRREVVAAQNVAAKITVDLDEYHAELDGD